MISIFNKPTSDFNISLLFEEIYLFSNNITNIEFDETEQVRVHHQEEFTSIEYDDLQSLILAHTSDSSDTPETVKTTKVAPGYEIKYTSKGSDGEFLFFSLGNGVTSQEIVFLDSEDIYLSAVSIISNNLSGIAKLSGKIRIKGTNIFIKTIVDDILFGCTELKLDSGESTLMPNTVELVITVEEYDVNFPVSGNIMLVMEVMKPV